MKKPVGCTSLSQASAAANRNQPLGRKAAVGSVARTLGLVYAAHGAGGDVVGTKCVEMQG